MSSTTLSASILRLVLICAVCLLSSLIVVAQSTTYGCYINNPPHSLVSPGNVRIVSSPDDCVVGETAIAWDVFPVGTSPGSVGFDGANIWVSNNGSNSITKLRASDGANLGTFPAGLAPGKSMFDGQNIWITNWTANTLTKLRASDGALLATIPVRNAPAGLAFDGTNIWASFYGNNSVSKLRLSDGAELSNTPGVNSPLDIVFDGVNIWAANNTGGGSVTKIDKSTGAILGVFNTNGGFPGAIGFDGNNIWVTNSGTQTLSKNRVSDGAVVGSFPLGFGGSGLAFDGANIWAANDDVVLKYRATDGALLGSFPGSFNGSGRYETAMAFDGTYVWVANYLTNTVTRYRDYGAKRTTYGCYIAGNPHPTRAPSDTRIVNGLGDCVAGETAISWDVFAVGATPASISFDGANVWISNAADGTITKFRASDGANLGTFQAGPGPGKSIRIGDSVWIPSYSTNTLRRIDANTGALIQTYPVRRGPFGMATDGTNLWVSYNGDWAVGKIDANTGQEIAIVGVPDAFDMVFDGANVWVGNKQADGKLTKIRASDASVQQIVNLGQGFPWSMTFDGANIWVNCTGTLNLTKVRASDGAVLGAFGEDFYGFGAAFDGQNIWVPNQSAVLKFRASDGILRGSFPGSVNSHGSPMSGAAFDGTNVWITSLTNNTVTRYHDYAEVPPDVEAPTTISAQSPNSNGAGWNNSDVGVSFSATDNHDGSGVSGITYSATGAQPISSTTVNGVNADLLITAEGVTTITYFARDNAGNAEGARTLVVRIDRSAPSVSCGSADGVWHANDVTITCTAIDGVSGLNNSSDGSFNLTTSVAANTETVNASTDSRNICDIAGNCATAGPVSGNKIDKKAPVITITTPTAGPYLLNQAVTVNFSCIDGGSGVGACVGTSANGGSLDTASTGAKTFTVNASDNVGNSASPSTVNYTVNFAFTVLFDQTRAHKSGSTVPIKIRLVDANGVNVSSAATVVHAVSVVQVGSEASPIVDDAGTANPDLDFRYDPTLGGYIFNLKTTGYGTGSYLLNFITDGGPSVYSVGFQVRQ